MKLLRVISAVVVLAAVLAWPSTAHADTVPACHDIGCLIKPGGVGPLTGDNLFCPSSKTEQVPAVRFSGDAPGLSANFDGAAADTAGQPATTAYEQRGIHPFSYSLFDEGCGGPALHPKDEIDTTLGNWMLGVSIDIAAVANATHVYATHPNRWSAPIDRLEANATKALSTSTGLWFSISLVCVAIVIIAQSRKGNVPAVLKTAAWVLLVLILVTIAVQEPVKAGRFADSAETQAVNTVTSAMAGEQAAKPSAAANLEVDNIIMPAWLKGELGSSDSPIAKKYGAQLLDATSLTWAEAASPDRAKIVAGKHDQFMKLATAIHAADPDGAYDALKGQSDGRTGAAFYALSGVLVTVPFRILADLLVMAALALIRISVIFLPLIAVFAVHERFAPLLRKLGSLIFGALLTALMFSAASALQIVATGFLIGPGSGIPNWVGLMLSAVLMVTMFFALRPVHRFMSLVPASTRQGVKSMVDTVETGVDLAVLHGARQARKERYEHDPAADGPVREADPGHVPAQKPDVVAEPVAEAEWGDVFEPPAPHSNGNGHNGNGHATAVIEAPVAAEAYDWEMSWPWTEDGEEPDQQVPEADAGTDAKPARKDPEPPEGFNKEDVA